jgi:hypothetical protein
MKRQIDTAGALVSAYRERRMPVPEIIADESFDEYDSASVFEAQLPGMVEENPSISEKLADIYTDKRTFQLLFETAMTQSWQIMNASITRFKYNAKGFALACF